MDESTQPPAADLQRPELYFNRELSSIELIRRVLEQAKDPAVPLLERLRFMCLSCTTLDEFFEIRVGSLRERMEFGSAHTRPDGLSAQETLSAINAVAHGLVEEQYSTKSSPRSWPGNKSGSSPGATGHRPRPSGCTATSGTRSCRY